MERISTVCAEAPLMFCPAASVANLEGERTGRNLMFISTSQGLEIIIFSIEKVGESGLLILNFWEKNLDVRR
jgi:hypothetical protein